MVNHGSDTTDCELPVSETLEALRAAAGPGLITMTAGTLAAASANDLAAITAAQLEASTSGAPAGAPETKRRRVDPAAADGESPSEEDAQIRDYDSCSFRILLEQKKAEQEGQDYEQERIQNIANGTFAVRYPAYPDWQQGTYNRSWCDWDPDSYHGHSHGAEGYTDVPKAFEPGLDLVRACGSAMRGDDRDARCSCAMRCSCAVSAANAVLAAHAREALRPAAPHALGVAITRCAYDWPQTVTPFFHAAQLCISVVITR